MSLKLTYALYENALVHISKVLKGIECKCFCPGCKAILVAKKGKIKQHHFAHYNTEECSRGVESALHLLAKDIIEQEKTFVIPSLETYDIVSKKIITLSKPCEIKVDSVDLEVPYENFKPDIVLHVGNKKIFVEIAVTHFVDYEKLEKLEAYGTSTIEIDLSYIDPKFTKESLRHILIESTTNKSWLYSNQEDYLMKKYSEKLRKEEERQRKDTANENEKYWHRIEQANKHGYRRLETNDYNLVICPKQLKENANKINVRHSIFTKLQNGIYWDGEIVKTSGGANFVTLENEAHYFTPSWSQQEKTSREDNKGYQRIWSILNGLTKQSSISTDDCKTCKHFDTYISEPFEVSCKFK